MAEPADNTAATPGTAARGPGYWALMTLHAVIIVNFVIEIAYSTYMVFAVIRPADTTGPLWGRASSMPFEMMSVRRMYATEGWLAIGGLAIYLAITEIGPRLRKIRGW